VDIYRYTMYIVSPKYNLPGPYSTCTCSASIYQHFWSNQAHIYTSSDWV